MGWFKNLFKKKSQSSDGSPSNPQQSNKTVELKIEEIVGEYIHNCTSLLSINPSIDYWKCFIKALVYAESGFDLTCRYIEKGLEKDAVTGNQNTSEGLTQMSYQDSEYHGCNFDWSIDKKKSEKDPSKTIFDIVNNIECCLIVLDKLAGKKGGVFFNDGHYWAVLKPENKRHNVFLTKLDSYMKTETTAPDSQKEESDSRISKKYPLSITLKDIPLMKSSGKYKNGFPEGIIIHFTAGWQNQKGIDAVKYANKMGHLYLFIDESGKVYQQFSLENFGAHAGESICPVTKRAKVAQYYVGIEVACGGRLEDADKDGQVDDTYFKTNVPLEKSRKGLINNKWQKSSLGTYEKFTEEQEIALKKLCTWLCENGSNPDLIFGHDEVAPVRKNDPGLSLSVPMDDFRKIIKGSLL